MDIKKLSLTFILLATAILLSTASTTQAQTYQTATTITGSSDQTTNYFNIPSSEWKITWSYTTSHPDYTVFSAFIYPKGETAMYTDTFSASNSQTSGVTYIHEGNKEYYLKIISANVDSYTITVEYEGASPSPSVPEFSGIIVILTIAGLFASISVATIVKRQHIKIK